MGTSLLDLAQGDPTAELIRALASPDKTVRDAARRSLLSGNTLPRQVVPGNLAHTLPATVSTARKPTFEEMLAQVRGGGIEPQIGGPMAPVSPPVLPAMHSAAPPMAGPDPRALPPMPEAGSMPVSLLADNSQPKGAIGQMLQGMLASAPPGPQTPPGAPPGPPPMPPGAPPMGGAPGPQAMLGLTPPGPTSGLLAPNAPMASPFALPPAPQSEPKPSMVERIQKRITSLLGGDATPGYEGLLSDKELQAGHSSPLWSLLGPMGHLAGEEVARQRLERLVGMKQVATGVAEQQRVREATARLPQLFPLPENHTAAQFENWAQNVYAYAEQNRLPEIATKFADIIKESIKAPKPESSKVLGAGGALVGPDGKLLYQVPVGEKTTDYTQYVDPQGNVHVLKKDQSPPAGWKTVPMSTTEIRVDAGNTRADTARTDKAVKDYTAQIKPLRDRAAVIDQALMTIGAAANDPNPNNRKVLYKSAVANFVQAADQKAQLRVQMLQYFNTLDPSIGGSWETLKDRLLKGERPAYQLQGMLAHLQNVRGLVQNEIETQRKGLVARRPELDSALPLTSEFLPDQSAASNSGAASLYSKYNLTPKK